MTESRTDLEERVALLERAVIKLIANVSAAGTLFGGVRHDGKEKRR